jgi:hypothetical protein
MSAYYQVCASFKFSGSKPQLVSLSPHSTAEYFLFLLARILPYFPSFGVFRNSDKPTPSEIGKALWDSRKTHLNLTSLYNVFSWYALEGVSRT